MRNQPRRRKKRKQARTQPPKHECSGANCHICEDQWASNQQRWSGRTDNIKIYKVWQL